MAEQELSPLHTAESVEEEDHEATEGVMEEDTEYETTEPEITFTETPIYEGEPLSAEELENEETEMFYGDYNNYFTQDQQYPEMYGEGYIEGEFGEEEADGVRQNYQEEEALPTNINTASNEDVVPEKEEPTISVIPGIDISLECGDQELTLEMILGKYGDDFPDELDDTVKHTPSDLEIKRRREAKRCDASVMARPRGYRELNLSVPQEELNFNIEVQIDEFEVEKDLAAERKIAFPSKVNTLWPTNDEFTKDKAEKRIEDYITRCWSLDPNWLFHIEFIQMSCTVSKRKYIYEVKFSMPTYQVPVPVATASVFFVLEVAYYEGHKEPVKVHYVVEGTRYQHVPGAIPFQQKWLRGVIVEKSKLQRLTDF